MAGRMMPQREFMSPRFRTRMKSGIMMTAKGTIDVLRIHTKMS
jgi:hypothetical protein